MRRCFVIAFIFILISIAPLGVSAQESAVSTMPSSPRPVWTVLLMENTASSPTLQLVDELSLVTTQSSIDVIQVPATFDTADLSEKLRLIRDMSPAATVAMWLDGEGTYRLAVVEDVSAPGPPSVHYIDADALPSVALLTRDFLTGRVAASEVKALPDDAHKPAPIPQATDAETPWDEPASEAHRTPSNIAPTLLGVGLPSSTVSLSEIIPNTFPFARLFVSL